MLSCFAFTVSEPIPLSSLVAHVHRRLQLQSTSEVAYPWFLILCLLSLACTVAAHHVPHPDAKAPAVLQAVPATLLRQPVRDLPWLVISVLCSLPAQQQNAPPLQRHLVQRPLLDLQRPDDRQLAVLMPLPARQHALTAIQ